MAIIVIILLIMVLIAVSLFIPASLFRPNDELTKYLALLPASFLMTVGFYLIFVWTFHANDGAPSSVVIFPATIKAFGFVAGVAGLYWLLRFMMLGPRHYSLALLAFLPCFLAAHLPSEAEMQARDKARKQAMDERADAEWRQYSAGRRYASDNELTDASQCPRREPRFVVGCQEVAAVQSPQFKQDTQSGMAFAKQNHLLDETKCPRRTGSEDGPSAAFTQASRNAVRYAVSELDAKAGKAWAEAHPEALRSECTQAAAKLRYSHLFVTGCLEGAAHPTTVCKIVANPSEYNGAEVSIHGHVDIGAGVIRAVYITDASCPGKIETFITPEYGPTNSQDFRRRMFIEGRHEMVTVVGRFQANAPLYPVSKPALELHSVVYDKKL